MIERSAAEVDKIVGRAAIAFIGAWGLVLGLHQLPLGGVWLPIAPSTWVLVILWPLVFLLVYLSSSLVGGRSSKGATRSGSPSDLSWPVSIMAIIGAFGAALVVFDFAFLRGYGFGTNVSEIRVEEVTNSIRGLSEASPISGLGRLMIPAILPALIVSSCNRSKINSRSRLILIGCLLIILFEQVFFEGGRTFVAASFVTTVFAFLIGQRRANLKTGPATRRTPFVRIAIVGAILLYFFLYVFISRVYDSGGFLWSHYRTFSRDFQIFVGTDVISRFDGVLGPFWYAASMLWLYITQGVNELDLLLASGEVPHSLGLYQVPQISPILSLAFGTKFTYDFWNVLPNVGTYLTIYGANYLDFGHIGAFLSAAILGFLTARGIKLFASASLSGLAICGPMLMSVALFSPVISVIGNLAPGFFWAIICAVSIEYRTRLAIAAR